MQLPAAKASLFVYLSVCLSVWPKPAVQDPKNAGS